MGNIVQAAVAISFINANDIDNMAVVIIFGDISDLLAYEKFRCPVKIPFSIMSSLTVFFGAPIIICISCGIV